MRSGRHRRANHHERSTVSDGLRPMQANGSDERTDQKALSSTRVVEDVVDLKGRN
jgi:hypothetical protein